MELKENDYLKNTLADTRNSLDQLTKKIDQPALAPASAPAPAPATTAPAAAAK